MIDLKTWLENAPVDADGQAWREMALALRQWELDVEIDDTFPLSKQLVEDLPPLRWGRVARVRGWDVWQGWNARAVRQGDGSVGAACYGPPGCAPLSTASVKELVALVLTTDGVEVAL